jgi:hypothetical protein
MIVDHSLVDNGWYIVFLYSFISELLCILLYFSITKLVVDSLSFKLFCLLLNEFNILDVLIDYGYKLSRNSIVRYN